MSFIIIHPRTSENNTRNLPENSSYQTNITTPSTSTLTAISGDATHVSARQHVTKPSTTTTTRRSLLRLEPASIASQVNRPIRDRGIPAECKSHYGRCLSRRSPKTYVALVLKITFLRHVIRHRIFGVFVGIVPLFFTLPPLFLPFLSSLSLICLPVFYFLARACLSVCARALYFLPAAFAHKVCAFVMPCGESLALFIFKCARVRHAYSCPAKITLAVGIRKIAKRKIKEQREVGERERAFFEWEKISFMIICFVARSDVAVLIYLPGL